MTGQAGDRFRGVRVRLPTEQYFFTWILPFTHFFEIPAKSHRFYGPQSTFPRKPIWGSENLSPETGLAAGNYTFFPEFLGLQGSASKPLQSAYLRGFA